MKLLITREHYKLTYTIGRLFIDYEDGKGWKYFCDTLEDRWRNIAMGEEKVPGETCIPSGFYTLKYDWSNHFNRLMIHILNVIKFAEVMIHNGNSDKDTRGCILVGFNKVKGKVIDSVNTLEKLELILKESGQTEWHLSIIDEAIINIY